MPLLSIVLVKLKKDYFKLLYIKYYSLISNYNIYNEKFINQTVTEKPT